MATGSFQYEGDPQRIVDEIREFLDGADQTLSNKSIELSETHGNICRAINERLRRCQEHLRASLWTEATQLADAEPNLMELCSVLDFKERPAWNNICQLYDDMDLAPSLMMDVYEALNRAYEYFTPLDSLFARHRTMALKRSPLRDRLKVMRQLGERDKMAAFWEEDIIEFERERLIEIREDATAAAEQLDRQSLEELMKEVTSPDWVELPPRNTVRAIKKLIDRVNQAKSRDQLPDLTDRLTQYWEYYAQQFQTADLQQIEQDNNWQEMQQLLNQWWGQAEDCGLLKTDPLFATVEPISQAVKSIKQNIQDARSLVSVLDRLKAALSNPKVTKRELEAAYIAVQQSGGMVPNELRSEYEKKLKQLWWRQHWEKVAGGAIFLILVLAFIIFVIVINL